MKVVLKVEYLADLTVVQMVGYLGDLLVDKMVDKKVVR